MTALSLNSFECEGPPGAVLTNHAQARMQQRHFNQADLDYVKAHGRLLRRTGICFYFLAARDVPPADRKLPWTQRLIGITVLASADQAAIITLYKNPNALRDIRKKAKFRA